MMPPMQSSRLAIEPRELSRSGRAFRHSEPGWESALALVQEFGMALATAKRVIKMVFDFEEKNTIQEKK
jgi:hypothetical protein